MRGIYFLTANGEKCLAGEDGRFTFRVLSVGVNFLMG